MHKLIYILLLPLYSFAVVQDNTTVWQDSSVLQQTPVLHEGTNTSMPPENRAVDHNGLLFMDTGLNNTPLKISEDSVSSWKKLKAFEYAGYLDSLLKLKQQRDKVKVQPTDSSRPSWLDGLLSSPATRVFFWILAGVFILFILYKLFLA